MRRERGTTKVGGEPESFTDELEVQLCLFSEWLEANGYSVPYTIDDSGDALTHFDLARRFLGRD